METAHLNVDLALEQLGGSLKLYRIIIEGFEEKYGDIASEIKGLSDAGKLEDAERLSHSIKGLSGNLGAKRLQEAAKNLEYMYKSKSLDMEEHLLTTFKEEMKSVLAEVNTYLTEINGASMEAAITKEFNHLETIKTIQRLMETLETHQYTLINTTYQNFKTIQFPEKDLALVASIKKAVEAYDYNLAKEILKTLLYSGL